MTCSPENRHGVDNTHHGLRATRSSLFPCEIPVAAAFCLLTKDFTERSAIFVFFFQTRLLYLLHAVEKVDQYPLKRSPLSFIRLIRHALQDLTSRCTTNDLLDPMDVKRSLALFVAWQTLRQFFSRMTRQMTNA